MRRRAETSERTCLVTREASSPEGLLRFVRAPDGRVAPDLKESLPGRGVWVTLRRDRVEEAVRKRLFSRGFRAEATADPDLADLVDRLLLEQALSALSMARKAGLVVTGFGKVTAALAKGGVVAVLHAAEAAPDGRRKVAQAMLRRARMEAGSVDADPFGADDEDDDGAGPDEPVHVPPEALPRVIAMFAGGELDLALGGANVIHAALLAGGASTSFLNKAAALARYRGGQPETDWMAGIPGSRDPGDPRHDGSFTDRTDAGGVRKATGED